METVFWIALAGSLYSYAIYPVLLLVITRLVPQESAPRPGDFAPRLSFIITARNEAHRIVAKVQDTLDQTPDRSAEVIIVSDASDDGMDDRVRTVSDSRVRLVRQQERRGKEAGQQLGITAAGGDILVFSDVATRIAPGSIQSLVDRFADSSVGAVSSEDRFVSADGQLAGEGLYVRYEMWLRRLESRLGGLVGLSGSFFAARRDVCAEWRTDVPSDFTVALTCTRQGLRAVSDANVIGIYPDLVKPAEEYARKRRTVIRGMAGLAASVEVLNPFRFGWFAFQAWSHKVLRWSVPWFLGLLLLANVGLATQGAFYLAFLLVQLAGYVLALGAWLNPNLRRFGLIRFGFYFVQVNLAMADAGVRFLRGERIVTWEPSRR